MSQRVMNARTTVPAADAHVPLVAHRGVGVLARSGRTTAGDQFSFTPDPNFEGKITLDVAAKRTIFGPDWTNDFNFSPGGVALQRVSKPAGSEQLIDGAIRRFSGQMTSTVDGQSNTVVIPPATGSVAAQPAKTPQADSPPNPLDGLARERLLSGFYSERVVVSARVGAETLMKMESQCADGTFVDEAILG